MSKSLFTEECWVIMSKDRQIIAKGVPRNRYLACVYEEDNGRILSYTTKKKAELGFQNAGFYISEAVKDLVELTAPEHLQKREDSDWRYIVDQNKWLRDNFIAIKCKINITEVEE